MIQDRDKTIVKNFLTSKEWTMVEQVITHIIADIYKQPKVADTEWETIKNTLEAEGQIKGLRRLSQELHTIAQQSK